jgi:hypothetical protein
MARNREKAPEPMQEEAPAPEPTTIKSIRFVQPCAELPGVPGKLIASDTCKLTLIFAHQAVGVETLGKKLIVPIARLEDIEVS